MKSESTGTPISSPPPPSYFPPLSAPTVSPNSSMPDVGPCRDNHPLCRKPNSGSGFLIGGGMCLFLIMGSSVIAAVYCRRRNPPITEGAAHAAQALIKMEGPYISVQVAMPGNSYPSHLAWPDMPEGSSKGGAFLASPDSTAHSLQGSLHGNCSWRGGNNSYGMTLFRPFRELGGEGETGTGTGRGTEMCDVEKGSSTIKASVSQNNQSVCLSGTGTETEMRSEMEMRTGTGIEMGTGSKTGVESRTGVERGTETEWRDIKKGASISGSSQLHLSQLQSTDSEEASSGLERMGPTRGSSEALKALQWAQVEEERKVANERGGHL